MDREEREKDEYHLWRENNIKRRDAIWESLANDPEFANVMEELRSFNKANKQVKTPKVRKRATQGDPTFRSCRFRPQELRKSARLQNKSPSFTENDLMYEPQAKRRRYDGSLYVNLEQVVRLPNKGQSTSGRSDIHRNIISVEDVTEEMTKNISRKVSFKVYSESGTCCHQCRQKTMDQKTCCRNVECVGLRGQFCGVCLENRYGEDVAYALKDPNWHCPVCRNICNCSFCRAKAGKRPTGILTPFAHQAGHKSVKDFLDSLQGEQDYKSPSDSETFKNPNNLLGLSNSVPQMAGFVRCDFKAPLSVDTLNKIIARKEREVMLLSKRFIHRYDLLGFVNENVFKMSNGTEFPMDFTPLKRPENFL